MQGRTGKIVLAILGVILMIVFILPGSMRSMSGGDVELGTIGDKIVRYSDVQLSADLYRYATENILVPVGEGQYVPLTGAVFQDYAGALADDPELFHLLVEEAQRTGSTMPREPLEQLLTSANAAVIVEDRSAPDNRRQVAFKDLVSEQVRETVLRSAGAVVSVSRSLTQFADFPRISTPLVDYFIAVQAQQADLRTVIFDAVTYLDRAQPPSEAAIQEHFAKYKDVLEGNATPENPFGFGYRLPDRVKLQYIMIPVQEVRDHVVDGLLEQSIVERERALYAYWSENRARFPALPTTQPATRSTTQPATGPATQPISAALPATQPAADPGDEALPASLIIQPATQPATQPTTQPATRPATQPSTQPSSEEALLLARQNPQVQRFLDEQAAQIAGKPGEADWKAYMAVHDDVMDRHLDGRASELQLNISRRLRDTLGSDYRAFDVTRTSATTARTRVGVPVSDPEYLERLSDAIAAEFGVRPRVASYARDFLSYEQVQEARNVGEISGGFVPDLRMMFGDYLFTHALDALQPDQRSQRERAGGGLATLAPSQPLLDLFGNEFVFRVLEARPDSAPESLAQVQEKVRQDLIKLAAYDIALSEARSFADLARRTSINAAAEAEGMKLHDPGPFVPGAGLLDAQSLGATEADDLITAAARNDFSDSFYKMLVDPELSKQEHPIGVLPMRPAFRVIVAELQNLVAGWGDEQMLGLQREQLREQLWQQFMTVSRPAEDFFDAEAVARRLGYVRERPRSTTGPAK